MIRAFVSSTFRDLKDHRAYVIERLERSGIFVDPMERWAAASDEPKDLSTERVKDCQLCILLVGFRLGHVPEGSSLSITQMEFAEANRCGLKVLVSGALLVAYDDVFDNRIIREPAGLVSAHLPKTHA